jgi:hypothetical protein
VFDRPHSRAGFLYGSRAVENICQGLCRDLVAHALLECSSAGLNVVMHIHDEVASTDSEGRLDDLLRIMSTGPAWADGFPILVEGYSGAQWSKHTSGYVERKMLRGRVCA